MLLKKNTHSYCLLLTVLISAWTIFSNKLFATSNNFLKKFELVKPAIVTIHTTPKINLLQNKHYEQFGTGVIISKKQGLILTNKHVIGGEGVFTYEVSLYDGKKVDAVLVFYDKLYDLALIKVDPKSIENLQELHVSLKDVDTGTEVFMVSTNQGKEFSYQEGVVSDESESIAPSNCQTLVLNLNAKPGSSGGAVINKNLEIIGLNFAGSDTYSLAIHRAYLYHLITDFINNKEHIRKTLGVVTQQINITDAVDYYGLPSNLRDFYLKTHPKSNGRILIVTTVVNTSNEASNLLAGDIIWEVNGKNIGNNVSILDLEVDKSDIKGVKIKVFRDGKLVDIEASTQTLESSPISEIIDFAGAQFFESDDTLALRLGIPRKTLLFNLYPSSATPFYNGISKHVNPLFSIYIFELISINDISIKSIKHLNEFLTQNTKSSKFVLKFKPLFPLIKSNREDMEFLAFAFNCSTQIADIDLSKGDKSLKFWKLVNNKWEIFN